MSTEFRGKVKQKVWLRSICTDDGEPFRLGQKARRDFKRACRGECPIHVASSDVIGVAFELGNDEAFGLDNPTAE